MRFLPWSVVDRTRTITPEMATARADKPPPAAPQRASRAARPSRRPPFARRGAASPRAASADDSPSPRPTSWHLHARRVEDRLGGSFTARAFGRALIMPNLVPPVRTVQDAAEYRAQILAAVPEGVAFEPQMTLYLTDNTSAADIEAAAASGFDGSVVSYLAGATTNSDFGVTDVEDHRGAGGDGGVRPRAGSARRGDARVRGRVRPRTRFSGRGGRGQCEGPRAVKGRRS